MEYSFVFCISVCIFQTQCLDNGTPEHTVDVCMTSAFSELKTNPVLRISSEQTLENRTLLSLDLRLSKSVGVRVSV